MQADINYEMVSRMLCERRTGVQMENLALRNHTHLINRINGQEVSRLRRLLLGPYPLLIISDPADNPLIGAVC